MSLLSTDRLCVALQPDRVALVKQRGRWRRQVAAKHAVAVAPGSGYAGAIASFADALSDPQWQRCKTEIVLSARFVRTAIVPALPGVRHDEALRLARHCLAEACGDDVGTWQITLGEGAWDSDRVACAIDPAMLDTLDATVRAVHGQLVSVRPFAMAAFDMRTACFDRGDAWFAAVEPGWCTLARIEGGAWKSVRTRRLFSEAGGEIAELLAQERLLADGDKPPERVVVASPNAPRLTIRGVDAAPVTLPPRAGFSPFDDASVAMALEGKR